MKRLALVLAVAAAVAAPAAAKEGAQAHLLSRLPSHPAPGSFVVVRWRVDVPGPNGTRRPFGASGMFVQLVGSGDRTRAFANQALHYGPPYSTRVRVPRGGIRAIRFGLMGTASTPTGTRPAPMWFTLAR
ncbi:MAG TPA: hypothetical protein VHC67_11560 [Gaiellaceae bacterium]|jgi:hypothetical protein|nr:hypothetical protein [Gaiellaceae bacterium]